MAPAPKKRLNPHRKTRCIECREKHSLSTPCSMPSPAANISPREASSCPIPTSPEIPPSVPDSSASWSITPEHESPLSPAHLSSYSGPMPCTETTQHPIQAEEYEMMEELDSREVVVYHVPQVRVQRTTEEIQGVLQRIHQLRAHRYRYRDAAEYVSSPTPLEFLLRKRLRHSIASSGGKRDRALDLLKVKFF